MNKAKAGNGPSAIVIAEAGVNHNGELEIARELIDVAAEAGADYVKFQTFITENLVSGHSRKAEYQKRNFKSEDDSQLSMLNKLELSQDQFRSLQEYSNGKGIGFLSTAFDLQSLEFLHDLGIPYFKIPSGEITNMPYLRQVGSYGRPVILSTGMSALAEVERALDVLLDNGLSRNNVTILHCNTDYPTDFSDVNLKAMSTMRKAFNVDTGYSDHTLGVEVPVAAVALGAVMIEKHFTLDRNMEGPDHRASLEPDELKKMVESIRNIEQSLGSGIKKPTESEIPNRPVARKSIHFARDVQKGDVLEESDLIMLRPGDGISPFRLPEILGRKLSKNAKKGDMLDYSYF